MCSGGGLLLLREFFYFSFCENKVVVTDGKALSLQFVLLLLKNVGPLSLANVYFSDLLCSNPLLVSCKCYNLQADY